jgi:hypothetical protein
MSHPATALRARLLPIAMIPRTRRRCQQIILPNYDRTEEFSLQRQIIGKKAMSKRSCRSMMSITTWIAGAKNKYFSSVPTPHPLPIIIPMNFRCHLPLG